MYSRRLRNQNGEHLINPYESNILETSHIPYMITDSELATTSESKNHIKIKTNRLRFMENGCI